MVLRFDAIFQHIASKVEPVSIDWLIDWLHWSVQPDELESCQSIDWLIDGTDSRFSESINQSIERSSHYLHRWLRETSHI